MPSLQENVIHIPEEKEIQVTKGVGQLIMDEIQKHLDKIAQIDPVTGQNETYGCLLSKSIRVAQNLRKRGLAPQDVISMCTYNNIDYSAVMIASFFIGTYTAPMDPTSPMYDFVHLLKIVTPKILFCDQDSEKSMEQAVKQAGLNVDIVVFGETDRNINFSEFLVEQEPENVFELHQPESLYDTCCIHFSSGTTGLPKAVCVTHYGLSYTCYVLQGTIERPSATCMIATTPFWISNMNTMILSIFFGDNRVLAKKFDAENCMKYVQNYKINIVFLTPANGAELLKNPENFKYDLSSLRVIGSGGSATPVKQFLQYFEALPNVAIIEGYGMTEVGGLMLKLLFKTEETLRKSNKAAVGTPIPGFTYKLVDPETEKVCGPNEPGELRVKCKGLFKSYYKNPKAYDDSFDSDGFFKSGDVLYYEDDYVFYYVTRIKDIFKYKGWHISPAIIEEELLKHPNINQAIIVGIPQPGEGEYATAAVILKDETSFDEQEIIQFANDKLPEKYHIRGGLYLFNSFPRTSTGKLQKRKITEYILNQKKHKL